MSAFVLDRDLACAFACVLGLILAEDAAAQSSPGQNWSSGWGFRSATDKSVALSRATTIMQAENDPAPTTVVNTTNYYTTDNRSNYVDVESTGSVTTDFQIGDEIGQNTNAVGSMNTGNTTIEVNGNSNSIDAINSAENTGCVDGSALTSTMSLPSDTGSLGVGSSAGGGEASAGSLGLDSYVLGDIASTVQDCVP